MAKRRKRDLALYVVEKGRWKLLRAELDWAGYLLPERARRPEADLFGAVLDYLRGRMVVPEAHWGGLERRRAAMSRRLTSLIKEARTLGAAGQAAFLKDPDVWEAATRVPSMGGEIEELRSKTRDFLEYYVAKFAGRRRRSQRRGRAAEAGKAGRPRRSNASGAAQ